MPTKKPTKKAVKPKKEAPPPEELQNESPPETPTIETPETQTPESLYAETLDKYQRCLADFDNYRKRTAKELTERHSEGVRTAIENLLPIIDNFERALAAHETKEDNFYKGIEMIARQLENMLAQMQVTTIPAAPGDTFDPNHHNAVSHIEDDHLGDNVITQVLQHGYMFKDKIIRYSMVQVAN